MEMPCSRSRCTSAAIAGSFISACTFFCSAALSAGDTVSQTLPLMAHEDCVRNRASETCWYLPTRAAAAAYIEAVLECSCPCPVSGNSWKTRDARSEEHTSELQSRHYLV